MKTAITAFLFLIAIAVADTEKAVDPFAEPPPKKVDRGADKKSVDFISDDILKVLQERRLDKGVGNEASGVIRITVLRSFHPPLAFMWFPAPEGQESWLEVKRAKMQTNGEGQRTYTGLDLNSRIKLRPSQTKNLQDFFQSTSIANMPQSCWQPEAMDGSTWIFEFAAEVPDRSTLLIRQNPIYPLAALEGSTITKERLLQESALTTFALLIWTLSGIDDVPPY